MSAPDAPTTLNYWNAEDNTAGDIQSQGEYAFSTGTGIADIVYTWAAVTNFATLAYLFVSKTDSGGVDQSSYWATLQEGDTITWYESSGRWLRMALTGNPVDDGHYRLPVRLVEFDGTDGTGDLDLLPLPITFRVSRSARVSKNYSITRSDVISAALRKIGVYDQGENTLGEEAAGAALALNLMVKSWTALGIDLFVRKELTVFLQKGTQKYSLNEAPGSAEFTEEYTETTLSADEASGQTQISVTSESGITLGDRIGIRLDDGSTHWSCVTALGTLTIQDSLPSGASSGNRVYAYTRRAFRPQKILYAHRRDSSGLDTPVDIIGENEYRNLSNKAATGPVNQVWYNPYLNAGVLSVWPTHSPDTDKLILVAQYLVDDLDESTDVPAFPIEWGEALIWGLAAELGPEYGLTDTQIARNYQIAGAKFNMVLDYDDENASVEFTLG